MDYKMNFNLTAVYNSDKKSNELYVFELGQENCIPDKPARNHLFEATTLHFIVSGEGYFEGQLLKAGDGFIVPEGELATYKVNPKNPWTYYWINITGSTIETLLNYSGLKYEKQCFSYTQIEKITNIFENAIDANYDNEDKNCAFIACLFNVFSILSYDNKQLRFCNNTLSKSEEHYNSAMRFISNNYSKKITVDDIAKNENIERHYLNRLFNIYSNSTPIGHLNNFRMEKACYLLRTTDLPVSIISSTVGYSDQLQFSKAFKKNTGVSPKKYREEFVKKTK